MTQKGPQLRLLYCVCPPFKDSKPPQPAIAAGCNATNCRLQLLPEAAADAAGRSVRGQELGTPSFSRMSQFWLPVDYKSYTHQGQLLCVYKSPTL